MFRQGKDRIVRADAEGWGLVRIGVARTVEVWPGSADMERKGEDSTCYQSYGVNWHGMAIQGLDGRVLAEMESNGVLR